jgi:uncharacterized repeat protein (TIGR04138 family)
MPAKKDFPAVIRTIRAKDPRYGEGAYHFVRHALDHTISNIKRTGKQPGAKRNHVSGQQLLDGIRIYALEQYGPMAKTLLETWKINSCEDFGEIVFNLVEHGILGKTDEDSREDFSGGYTFKEAFADPFLPKSRRSSAS